MINERPIAITQEEQTRSAGSGQLVSRIATHSILIVMAVLMIFPLIWLISTSLKAPSKQMLWPPQFIPNPVYFKNYSDLFVLAPMTNYLFNSFKISVLSVIGVCFSSSLAAFAFARMHFRGREILFGILLATMMLPYAVTIVPTFVIMKNLGWLNTHYPLIVPAFFGSAYFVFLLRQSYRAIPQDLFDSATIDGAGYFQIYYKIFIPLGMPALVTVALFAFLGSWNDLFGPLIYLSSQEKMTVALGLTYLRGRAGTGVERVGVIMAGSMLGVVPMLILYAFGQKYFIQGLARTGLKG
jgi:ABC-type glycerol-3-phosphate transport system permease component